MAINILSSNLNLRGDQGGFEADPSTWGMIINGPTHELLRYYGAAKVGNFACQSESLTASWSSGRWYSGIYGLINATDGDKYIVKAWIRKHPYNPSIATDDAFFRIESLDGLVEDTDLRITKTVSDANGQYVEINAAFTNVGTGTRQFLLYLVDGGSDTLTNGGQFLADQFEIFRYEDVAEPACDLEIDTGNTTVTDESTPGAGDGSIDVAITGGSAPIEYALVAGSAITPPISGWQSSSQFTGLDDGLYTAFVRDAGSCADFAAFYVNTTIVSWSFTAVVTDVSVIGAEDGQIDVTVVGTGGPFTYSKDGGQNYQAGNSFTGLAPGDYIVAVKDASDNVKALLLSVGTANTSFDQVYFSRNPIIKTLYATANYGEDNYQVYIDVRVEDTPGSGTFISKLITTLPPEELAQFAEIDFNIRQAFRGIFSPQPPAQNANAMALLTDRSRFYKIYYGDIYDDKNEPDSLSSTSPYLVVLGGLSKYKFPDLDYFTTDLPANKRFMTWAPTVKLVDLTQEDYLQFFVHNTGITELKVRIKAYYDDDTTDEDTISVLSGVEYGSICLVPAGPGNSGASAIDPAKNLQQYELWLVDQDDTVISEVRTYKLTPFKSPDTMYLLALNSLGAFECHRITGLSDEVASYEGDIFERYLGADYNALDGQYVAGDVHKQNAIKASTGYFTGSNAQEWLEYMQDLLLSRKVYDITDGVRRPVVIRPGSAMVRNEQDNQRYVRFEMLRAYSDHSYTPDDV